MHWLFMLGKSYPYWAIALLLAFFQFGVFFRRRKEWPQYLCGMMVLTLFVTTILWFVYRGDIHSDEWIYEWFIN